MDPTAADAGTRRGEARVRTVRIVVTLKPGVLDAPGQAIRRGLHALGHAEVEEVRAGRYFEIDVAEGGDLDHLVREMCEGFLANPLIEQYRYEVV